MAASLHEGKDASHHECREQQLSLGSGPGGTQDIATAVETSESNPTTPEGTSVALATSDRMAGRSPGQVAWDRLRHDKVAIVCMTIIVLFVLVAIFAPQLCALEGQDPDTMHQELIGSDTFPTIGSTAQHWFGLEPGVGRDLFARWAYGARPSLVIGFVAAIFSTLIGVAMGLVAGYLGGMVDRVISWIIDLMLSLPFLLMVLALVPIVQSRFAGGDNVLSQEEKSNIRFWLIIAILVVFGWMGLARLIRGEVLSLREREFVQAARVIGVPTRKILVKEILPNLVGPIIVSASIAVPAYISSEAVLSYLGAGLVEPTASWGRTVSSGVPSYSYYPLYLWPPVISISLLVLALSLLGESIRDAFDPNARAPMKKDKRRKGADAASEDKAAHQAQDADRVAAVSTPSASS